MEQVREAEQHGFSDEARMRDVECAIHTLGLTICIATFAILESLGETVPLAPNLSPADPRGICPGCGEKALDGKLTCGNAACGSSTGQDR